MNTKPTLSKYASILNRLGMQFYDQELTPLGIGGGQQFFLVRIYEDQGISAKALAQKGYFDKATATRALQRLEELGYVRRLTDEDDRRKCRFYTTEKAGPVIDAICAAAKKWNEILTHHMPREDAETAARLMDQMAKNAYEYISNSIGGGKNGRECNL